MPEPRSPLTADYRPGRYPHGSAGEIGVSLREVTGRDLVQVACWRGRDDDLRARLGEALALAAPEPGWFSTDGKLELVATAPERYWCLGPRDDTRLVALRDAIGDDLGCMTELGHSHVRVRIAGPAARRLLMQEIAIDLAAGEFPTGRAARTVLHHVPVTVLCIDADDRRFDLFLPHTYAASLWSYLLDLAVPFGYVVEERRAHD